jgi:thioredoxin-like negative regulator of GroEL
MSNSRARWSLMFACGLLAAATATTHAQDTPSVQWRTDYSKSRIESETKNVPMLIYFTRPACVYCDKMEANTYRDPRIISVFNEKLIVLKINGQEQPELAAKLKISAYPTLILASPNGEYEKMVGYQDADLLQEKIHRVLATIAPSENLQRDYENALKWEAAGRFDRAIAVLLDLTEASQARPIQKSVQELLEKIEKRAEDNLAKAKELQDKGKNAEALETLTDTLRQFPGLKASNLASEMITKLVHANGQLRIDQRTRRAAELMAQAQSFYETKDFIPCLDRCEILLSDYPDLPEGQKAFKLVGELKNNREWLQNAADVMTDRLGGLYLVLADSYLKSGEVPRARDTLRLVVTRFPGSRLAESAQLRLNQLQGTMPTAPAVQNARP